MNLCYNVAPTGYILDDKSNPKKYTRTNLLKLTSVNNIEINDLNPPFGGRYTMEFWFLNSSSNLPFGIHFIWKNLLSISLIQDTANGTNLNLYCWPQDYKVPQLKDLYATDFNSFVSANKNVNFNQSTVNNYRNNWVNVRCAMNYQMRAFYLTNILNGVENIVNSEIKPELISKDNSNDYPLRYFWQNNELTSLSIVGANKNPNTYFYLRSLALFSDFLTTNYSFRN